MIRRFYGIPLSSATKLKCIPSHSASAHQYYFHSRFADRKNRKEFLYERLGDLMISSTQLIKMRDAELTACHLDTLVDLRDISIDTSKPVIERIESFLQQVKNPYLFKVDDIIIKVKYGTGKTFEDALSSILTVE